MSKTGVLFINLGTPDDCDPKSVRAYLKQFLNDPRVIDLPKLTRTLLVNGVIIPFRYQKSAEAYQKIWTEQGSPLLVNSQILVDSLRKACGPTFQIELGMRYGNPSIEAAFDQLKDCPKLIVIPLFPQYASAATGSAIEAFLRVVEKQWNIPDMSIKGNFYDNPDFISAYADIIKESIASKPIDTIMFSYHGLPERHLDKSACRAICTRLQPCPKPDQSNAYCYRAQCYETSRLIAEALNLSATDYVVSFQSRLGRTPWIKPYTDLKLAELRTQNIENIAVVCPSFVSDCLETLEEINIRARAQWLELGGRGFTFIPCLNSHPLWIAGLVKMIKNL